MVTRFSAVPERDFSAPFPHRPSHKWLRYGQKPAFSATDRLVACAMPPTVSFYPPVSPNVRIPA
jgi:hypothetical protein